MRVYIAGPYTKGDVAVNVRNAIHAGDVAAHFGHTPFVPHLSHFWHMQCPREYEFWMDQDMQWLKLCEAVLRLPGESAGADAEVKWAQENGLKIFYSVFDLPREP